MQSVAWDGFDLVDGDKLVCREWKTIYPLLAGTRLLDKYPTGYPGAKLSRYGSPDLS